MAISDEGKLCLNYSSIRRDKETPETLSLKQKCRILDMEGALRYKGFSYTDEMELESLEGSTCHKAFEYVINNLHEVMLRKPLFLFLDGDEACTPVQLIAQEAIPYQYNCIAVDLNELYAHVSNYENDTSSGESAEGSKYYEYMGCDLLVIKDFENLVAFTPNKRGYLKKFIKKRIVNKMPLIVCSSVKIKKLKPLLEDGESINPNKIEQGSLYALFSAKFNFRHVPLKTEKYELP